MTGTAQSWSDQRVALVRLTAPGGGDGGAAKAALTFALDRLAQQLEWSDQRGCFAKVVPPGGRVVVKPNFVLDRNQGPWGMGPLVTDPLLVQVVVEKLLQCELGTLLVGDAPLQACDFVSLLCTTGLRAWADALQAREARFQGIRDFRRTTCVVADGVRIPSENLQPEEDFVLFDLTRDSLLEPVSDGRGSFRVTYYDPTLMVRTHSPGRHQYLIARQILEADLVVNLPKLKTHKKAGITCALKNLVGINGNKEFLPHHRLGGSATGGDCYPGGSLVKRALEYVLDEQNSAKSLTQARVWTVLGRQLQRISTLTGDRIGVEGAWSGNDTVWRMCLDLNRILLYGTPQGTMSEQPQRRVIHIVDAMIAGQGDGPLAPQPLPLGLLLGGNNAAAVDWIGAQLLGYQPECIPIVAKAFADFRWPLTAASAANVRLLGDLGHAQVLALAARQQVIHPVGWRNAARARSSSDQSVTMSAPASDGTTPCD